MVTAFAIECVCRLTVGVQLYYCSQGNIVTGNDCAIAVKE